MFTLCLITIAFDSVVIDILDALRLGVGTQSHQFFHSGPDDDKRSVLMRTDPGSG